MTMDLNTLGLDELKALEKSVAKAIESFESRRLEEARSAAEAVAREHGFTLNQLVDSKPQARRAKAPSLPKFANPENPSETWTGRGRKPGWFAEGLNAGKTPDYFKV